MQRALVSLLNTDYFSTQLFDSEQTSYWRSVQCTCWIFRRRQGHHALFQISDGRRRPHHRGIFCRQFDAVAM